MTMMRRLLEHGDVGKGALRSFWKKACTLPLGALGYMGKVTSTCPVSQRLASSIMLVLYSAHLEVKRPAKDLFLAWWGAPLRGQSVQRRPSVIGVAFSQMVRSRYDHNSNSNVARTPRAPDLFVFQGAYCHQATEPARLPARARVQCSGRVPERAGGVSGVGKSTECRSVQPEAEHGASVLLLWAVPAEWDLQEQRREGLRWHRIVAKGKGVEQSGLGTGWWLRYQDWLSLKPPTCSLQLELWRTTQDHSSHSPPPLSHFSTTEA